MLVIHILARVFDSIHKAIAAAPGRRVSVPLATTPNTQKTYPTLSQMTVQALDFYGAHFGWIQDTAPDGSHVLQGYQMTDHGGCRHVYCVTIDSDASTFTCPVTGVMRDVPMFIRMAAAHPQRKHAYWSDTPVHPGRKLHQVRRAHPDSWIPFSDAHSAPRIGREFTVFDTEITYLGLLEGLKRGSVAYTGEFYSEVGKYHYDGHRRCGISQHPTITTQIGPDCSVCNKPLTLGVLNRVLRLSNEQLELHHRSDGFITVSNRYPPFINLIPLKDIIAQVMQKGANTKVVGREYLRIMSSLGSEIEILVRLQEDAVIPQAGEDIARAIINCRKGDVLIEPGYDGVYGKICF